MASETNKKKGFTLLCSGSDKENSEKCESGDRLIRKITESTDDYRAKRFIKFLFHQQN